MDEKAKRGRTIVFVFIAMFLLMSLTISLVKDLLIPPAPSTIGNQVFRFILSVVLCWFLYDGRGWAKWILVCLLALGSMFGLVGAFSLLGKTSFAWIVLTTSAIYAAWAFILALSPSVSAFMEFRNTLRVQQ